MSSQNDPGVNAERNAVIVANKAEKCIGQSSSNESQNFNCRWSSSRSVESTTRPQVVGKAAFHYTSVYLPRSGYLAQRYATQRPKSDENWGGDIELKARSQPTGGFLPARSSDDCDLPVFLAWAGAVGRSPLSARLTDCGLKSIPCALGNDGNETRTIEQIAVATTARRTTVLLISPSHPKRLDGQTIRIALCSSIRRHTNV